MCLSGNDGIEEGRELFTQTEGRRENRRLGRAAEVGRSTMELMELEEEEYEGRFAEVEGEEIPAAARRRKM